MADDSFVRWQNITLNQLTYAINLILGLALAALGFGVNMRIEAAFSPVGWSELVFNSSLLLLLLSVSLGISCVINRLRDFRLTMRLARKREKQQARQEIERLRARSGVLGKWTWRLFWSQIVTFGCGVLLLVLSVFVN